MPRSQDYIWTTREGQQLYVTEMTDTHLLNAINYLRRAAPEAHRDTVNAGYSVVGTLQGEMASYYAERDLSILEDTDPIECLIIHMPIYSAMLIEARRRELEVAEFYEEMASFDWKPEEIIQHDAREAPF